MISSFPAARALVWICFSILPRDAPSMKVHRPNFSGESFPLVIMEQDKRAKRRLSVTFSIIALKYSN